MDIRQGAPANAVCYRQALVPGYIFTIFNDFQSADTFRRDTYNFLQLPIAEQPALQTAQIIYAQRTAKRVLNNREDVLKRIATLPTKSGVTLKVKNIIQGKLTFEQQVKNMHQSNVLMGMHGADLTNCIFMHKGSVVLEINPLNWYDARFVRMCETAGVHYLSYNEGGDVSAPYPFGHFPPVCSFKLKPLIDCKMTERSSQRENVDVEMAKFIAIVGEALYLAGVGPRVISDVYEDFKCWALTHG